MKHRLIIILTLICSFSLVSIASYGGAKQDKRVAYVLAQLKLPAETSAKLKPMLQAYLKEKKDANSPYDDLKEKYDIAIKKGTITDKQGELLLKEKWAAEQKELEVKKAFAAKFRTVLSPKTTYLCFTLLNDKWSKIEAR